MTPFIFPTTVAVLVFGSWLILASIEPCITQHPRSKLDCWTSVQLVAIFGCVGSLLVGLIALLSRVMLHAVLSFESVRTEVQSAFLTSIVLTLLFYTLFPWEFEFGNLVLHSIGWLVASFVVCCASLLIVNYLTLKRRVT